MKEIEEISWDDLMLNLQILSHQIPPNSLVYGIPRGGVIIAYLLNYQVPSIRVINSIKTLTPDTIIVDDIVDSGQNLKNWLDEGFRVATVYFRNSCIYTPTYYAKKLEHTKWIRFPYESSMYDLPGVYSSKGVHQ